MKLMLETSLSLNRIQQIGDMLVSLKTKQHFVPNSFEFLNNHI